MDHRPASHQPRMIALLALPGLVAALSLAAPAAARDKNTFDAREVAHCMQARMKKSQSETYREAFKVCKQQLDTAGNDATAMNTVAAATPPKR